MNLFRLKATTVLKACVFGVVMSGVVVACQDVAQVAKPVPTEDAISTAVDGSKSSGSILQQSDAERDSKIAEAKQKRMLEIQKFLQNPATREMSDGLAELAEAVAIVVDQQDVRERIYAKCMEKFDGDSEVLWQHLESDNVLRSRGGWNKIIKSARGKNTGKSVINKIGSIETMVAKFESNVKAPLHIFWTFPKNWDKKTSPIVAFIPFDPAIPFATAFDSKGNRYQLDRNNSEIAKQRPVLVIGVNERCDMNGKLKKSLDKAQSLPDKHKSSSLSSDTYSSYVILRDIFFSAFPFDYSPLGVYDEWLAGEPEFYVNVRDYLGNWYVNTYMLAGNQELATNTLHYLNTVIPWQHYPQTIKVQYWEEDFWFADDYMGEHDVPSFSGVRYFQEAKFSGNYTRP